MQDCSTRKLLGPMMVALLSLTILFSSATGTVMGAPYEGFEYVLIEDDTEVQITKYIGAGGDVVIPPSIEGKSVTAIGNYAFQMCSSLTSIEMPDSIVTIGRSAFQDCVGLTSVIIPANVKSIGIASFSDCTSLSDITLPDGLLQIGSYAFDYCPNLTSLIIPDSVTRIDKSAFRDCANLISVTLPNSLTTLGDSVFFGCVNLTSIIIPEGVPSLGSLLFQGCTRLTSVVIPESVTVISSDAFADCENLISVTLPDSLTTLGGSAFLRCDNLTSIVIPANVGAIGGQAFADCGSLTEIKFMGDAPTVGANWIRNHDPDLVIYHLGSAIGFDAEAWVGLNLIPLFSPGAPQDVRAVGHRESVVVPWDASLTDGNSTITGYEVLYNAGEGWIKYGDILSADERSITLTGLEAGKSYEFAVKAINAIGASAMSDASSAMPFTTPAAPQISAVAGDGCVTLSWNELVAPENGWADIDYYVIYVDGVEVDQTVVASCIVTELNNGQSYSFVVVAHNAAGDSVLSNSVLATPFTVPDAPTGVTASAGDGQVTLNWTAPAFDGGSPISAYEIWLGTSDNASKWTKHGESLNASTLNATVSGLEADTKYYFGVKAINAAGSSGPSSTLSAETWPALVPISGKVVDAEGNGLAGVMVTLDNATSATTDADGKFVIMTSRGAHALTVSGEGIESFTNNVTVDGLGLDLVAIEASVSTADPSGDMGMFIIAAVAVAAVLAGVLGLLRWRKK